MRLRLLVLEAVATSTLGKVVCEPELEVLIEALPSIPPSSVSLVPMEEGVGDPEKHAL